MHAVKNVPAVAFVIHDGSYGDRDVNDVHIVSGVAFLGSDGMPNYRLNGATTGEGGRAGWVDFVQDARVLADLIAGDLPFVSPETLASEKTFKDEWTGLVASVRLAKPYEIH